ncbi:hypothetical protein KNP414_07183 [Paenibacillus mucilaginosus KNP414]|uniref:Uncharacterized protein n=1 Tax=Paenibacillus mucilaginosus (strain KNP414) TaxID=1036673 RepID=F8FN23_PAEMK|nr:hypothetical protein KNP414_07183 [Paenibacillus mucilaginosus KNP414]
MFKDYSLFDQKIDKSLNAFKEGAGQMPKTPGGRPGDFSSCVF